MSFIIGQATQTRIKTPAADKTLEADPVHFDNKLTPASSNSQMCEILKFQILAFGSLAFLGFVLLAGATQPVWSAWVLQSTKHALASVVLIHSVLYLIHRQVKDTGLSAFIRLFTWLAGSVFYYGLLLTLSQ